MQNEEKLLTINDAYDVVVDYLEKFYNKTKSDDIELIVGGMPLMSDGDSVDSAMLEDWNKAVEKTFIQNPDIRQSFDFAGKKLNARQAYEVMINYLGIYNYLNEIVTILDSMRFAKDGMPADPEMWTPWLESVDKILSQNPRIRPLFFGINTKILTLNDTYDTTIDFLSKCYDKTNLKEVEELLKRMNHLENDEFVNPIIWENWNKAVNKALTQNSESVENGFNAKQGYEVGINFLDMYGHKINSNEIIAMLDAIKRPVDIKSPTSPEDWHLWLESVNPEYWRLWLESVNKTLNKYRKF